MPVFKLRCVRENGNEPIYYYNNITNVLSDTRYEAETVVRGNIPRQNKTNVKKDIKRSQVIKIQLGTACNQRCAYCSQEEYRNSKVINFDFTKLLVYLLDNAPPAASFEFWGGEPLLYSDLLLSFASELRKKFIESQFLLITNGSLLSHTINTQLDTLNFTVGISHDGPGQSNRGQNIFDFPSKKALTLELFNTLSQKQAISFNCMLTKDNYDRRAIVNYFKQQLGTSNFCLGEGGIIHATNQSGGLLSLITVDEHINYRLQLLQDIRFNRAPNFHRLQDNANRLLSFINGDAFFCGGSLCGFDCSNVIIVDLLGRLLVCQGASAEIDSTMTYGSIFDIDTALLASQYFLDQDTCFNCPIVSLCRGACPITPEPFLDTVCSNFFSDHIPFLSAVVEYMTGGALPYLIEGPNDIIRWDLFGVTNNPRSLH